jgi:hypothetical protein
LDRRNDILYLIEKNYGIDTTCIATELKMGRPTVSRYVNELLGDGLVLNLSQRKNRNKLVPNKNNEIVITRNLITAFKEKYYNLLDNSLKHPQLSNVIDNIKPESDKWDDKMAYGEILDRIYSEFKKAEEIYSQKTVLVKETEDAFSELANKKIFTEELKPTTFLSDYDGLRLTPYEILQKKIADLKSKPMVPKTYARLISESDILVIKNLAERIVLNTDKINRFLEQYSIHVANSGYLVLTYWPILLFFLFEYTINLKSIITWPDKIIDRELLTELNEFVYGQFKEMKDNLIDFLIKSKNERLKGDIESVIQNINPLDEEDYFIKMFYDYSMLRMKETIVDVIDCLMNIRQKDIQYDEQKMIDDIYESSKGFLD